MDYDALYERLEQSIPDEAMLSSVKEIIEDERIKEKKRRKTLQADGIAKAKENNVQLGRKPTPKPKNYEQIMALFLAGSISGTDSARLMNVSRTVLYRWAKEEQANSQ